MELDLWPDMEANLLGPCGSGESENGSNEDNSNINNSTNELNHNN